MAISPVIPFTLVFSIFLISGSVVATTATVVELEEAVLTLDASNFSEVVAKHQFIVIKFYAPWYVQLTHFLKQLCSVLNICAVTDGKLLTGVATASNSLQR
jgi:hypothetical protein